MTWNNLDPLANPLNSRSYYRGSFNKNCKTLPLSNVTYEQMMNLQAQLHIPFLDQSYKLADILNIVDLYSSDKTWNNDNSIYDIATGYLENAYGLSKKEQEYWQTSNAESARLSSSLSKEWLMYLQEFDSMHPSKFEDEV